MDRTVTLGSSSSAFVDVLRQNIPKSRDECFTWVSDEFDKKAWGVYSQIGAAIRLQRSRLVKENYPESGNSIREQKNTFIHSPYYPQIGPKSILPPHAIHRIERNNRYNTQAGKWMGKFLVKACLIRTCPLRKKEGLKRSPKSTGLSQT